MWLCCLYRTMRRIMLSFIFLPCFCFSVLLSPRCWSICLLCIYLECITSFFFSLPHGVMVWLWLVIAALPGLHLTVCTLGNSATHWCKRSFLAYPTRFSAIFTRSGYLRLIPGDGCKMTSCMTPGIVNRSPIEHFLNENILISA